MPKVPKVVKKESMSLDITDFNHFLQLAFAQYPMVQSEFENLNLAYCRRYFSHREHREELEKNYLVIFSKFCGLCEM